MLKFMYHTLMSHIPSFLRGMNRSLSSRTFPVAGIAARKTEITKRTEISHLQDQPGYFHEFCVVHLCSLALFVISLPIFILWYRRAQVDTRLDSSQLAKIGPCRRFMS